MWAKTQINSDLYVRRNHILFYQDNLKAWCLAKVTKKGMTYPEFNANISRREIVNALDWADLKIRRLEQRHANKKMEKTTEDAGEN